MSPFFVPITGCSIDKTNTHVECSLLLYHVNTCYNILVTESYNKTKKVRKGE